MSDNEQKIRDGTLDDNASIAELLKRHERFTKDTETPADLKSRGLEIFHTAIYTDTLSALQAGERVVIVLRRTIEALGALYLEEERRRAASLVVEMMHSAGDDVPAHPQEAAPTSASEILQTTQDIVAESDGREEGHDAKTSGLKAAIAARQKRRLATHGPRPRTSAAAGVVKAFKRTTDTSKPDTVSSEPIFDMPSASGPPSSFLHPSNTSKQPNKAPSPQPTSLIITLRVPNLPEFIYQRNRASGTPGMKRKSPSPVADPRVKRKYTKGGTSQRALRGYRRKSVPKSAEFVVSDSNDDEDRDPEMQDAPPGADIRDRARKTEASDSEAALASDMHDNEDETTEADDKPAVLSTRAQTSKQSSSHDTPKRNTTIVTPDDTHDKTQPAQTPRRSKKSPLSSHPQPRTRATKPASPAHLASLSPPPRSWSTISNSPSPSSTPSPSLSPHHSSPTTTTTNPTFPTTTPFLPSTTNRPPFPPLPPLPPPRRAPFRRGAHIALENVRDDHRAHPTETLAELLAQLEGNRPQVEDWERRTVVRGGGWVYGALRAVGQGEGEGEEEDDMMGDVGGGGGEREDDGEKTGKAGVDIEALVARLEEWFEGEWERMGWSRERGREDEGGSGSGSEASDIWAND